MNRRNFMKLLGKATIASGVAAVSGLPEMADVVEELPLVIDKDQILYAGGKFTSP